jgi:hypothetical protein
MTCIETQCVNVTCLILLLACMHALLVRYLTLFFFFFQFSTIGLVIGGIWCISILSVLPTAFYTGTRDFFFPKSSLLLYHVCMEQWPNASGHLVYSVILMVVQYIFPITVILVTHVKIISIVKARQVQLIVTQILSAFCLLHSH